MDTFSQGAEGSGTGAEASGGRLVREQPSRRHSVRLTSSIGVRYRGETLTAADWSVSGLRLHSLSHEPLPETFRIELSVELMGCSLQLPLTCGVVWRDDTASQVGCRFIDVDGATAGVLRTVFGATLEGRVAVADDLLQLGPQAASRALFGSGPSSGMPVDHGLLAAMRRSGRYVSLGAFGIAVISLASMAVYDRLFTVEADLAAVSAPGELVLAPTNGVPAAPALLQGSRVRAGETLAVIASAQLIGERDIAAADLKRDEAHLEALQAAVAKRGQFFREYSQLAEADLASAKAELRRAQKAGEISQRSLQRAEELRRSGIMSAAASDAARDAAARATRDLEAAKSGVETAQSNLRLAQNGHFYTGSRIEGADPEDLSNSVRVATASVESARVRVEALNRRIEGLTVRSQCDCIVQSSIGNRTWVQQGEVLYVLTSVRSDDHRIQALVTQDSAAKIAVGSPAVVRLADREGEIVGRVTAIDRQRNDAHRLGLPAASVNDMRYASVLVAADGGAQGADVGVPALVRFNVRPEASVLAFVEHGNKAWAGLTGRVDIGQMWASIVKTISWDGIAAVAKPLDDAAKPQDDAAMTHDDAATPRDEH